MLQHVPQIEQSKYGLHSIELLLENIQSNYQLCTQPWIGWTQTPWHRVDLQIE